MGAAAALILPALYQILSGDLVGRFNGTLFGQKVQLTAINSTQTIFVASLHSDSSGGFVIPCGCITTPGEYVVGVHTNNGTLAEEIVTATWPQIEISMPQMGVALSQSMEITFKPAPQLCTPINSPSYQTVVELLYRNPTNSMVSNFTKYGNDFITDDWWNLRQIILPCNHFQVAGLYKVRLRTTLALDVTIGESNHLQVDWPEGQFSLKMSETSVFPCPGREFPVSFSTNSVCPVDSGRIRVYAVLDRPDNSMLAPWALRYISEKHTHSGSGVVGFSCSSFDQIYPAYCFTFVTVAEIGGSVYEHLRKCVRTRERNHPISAAWSNWSEWGACTATCGSGVRHRTRRCQTPYPMHKSSVGILCGTNTITTQVCTISQSCPSQTTTVPKPPPRSRCQCGCILTTPGIVVVSLRCLNTSVWEIQAPPNQHVLLEFTRSNMAPSEEKSLRIRDGPHKWSNLIVDLNNFEWTLNKPIISTQNRVLVEFVNLDSQTDEIEEADEIGVILNFKFIDKEFYEEIASANDDEMWWSLLPWWGILLVVLGCLFLTCCVMIGSGLMFYQYTKRRLKRKLNLLMTSSLQTTSSLGPFYDPFRIGNRQSAESEKFDPSSMEYKRISGDEDSLFGSTPSLTKSNRSSAGPSRQQMLAEIEKQKQRRNGNLGPKTPGNGRSILQGIPEVPEENSVAKSDAPAPLRSEISPSPQLHPRHRSIGIQLNSPAMVSLRRQRSMGSSIPSISTLPNMSGRGSPSLSNDYEYDYYEPDFLPGSFLHPSDAPWEELNIDDILLNSELMRDLTTPIEAERTPTACGENPINPIFAENQRSSPQSASVFPPSTFVNRAPMLGLRGSSANEIHGEVYSPKP